MTPDKTGTWLNLTLCCVEPPTSHNEAGEVLFGLQDREQTLHAGELQTDGALRFACRVLVKSRQAAAPPDFAGDFVHGAKGERFLYLSLRKPEGGWVKRIKVMLTDISWGQIGQVENAGGGLSATLSGQGAARARLLGDGWTHVAG